VCKQLLETGLLILETVKRIGQYDPRRRVSQAEIMKTTSADALLVYVISANLSAAQPAVVLPDAIRAALNAEYPGWRLGEMTTEVAVTWKKRSLAIHRTCSAVTSTGTASRILRF
jgi:hypothetical protein